MFQNRSIRHIQMGIRHMWRVANGLDNAALEYVLWNVSIGGTHVCWKPLAAWHNLIINNLVNVMQCGKPMLNKVFI